MRTPVLGGVVAGVGLSENVGGLFVAGDDPQAERSFVEMVLAERVVVALDGATLAVPTVNEKALDVLGLTLVGLDGRPLADLCVDRSVPDVALADLAAEPRIQRMFAVMTPSGA